MVTVSAQYSRLKPRVSFAAKAQPNRNTCSFPLARHRNFPE